jgi:hypothetical protein
MRRLIGAVLILASAFASAPVEAGFRSPESLIRNVYAFYGTGSPELSDGLPRDADTARQFFDPSLRTAWAAAKSEPYDFLVQSPTWRVGPVSITILRKQYDKTYVSVAFDNMGRSVRLNYVLIKGTEGWLITDVESPYDSLREYLDQFKN